MLTAQNFSAIAICFSSLLLVVLLLLLLSPFSSLIPTMQFKALHSSSPYIQIQTKTPILNKQQSTLPSCNSPFNINFNHCPQTPLNFCVSKRITQRILRKLRCISATPELEALDPQSEITISDQNGCKVSSQMQEMTISSEKPEMVETTSGSLANQGLWEQMVEIIKFSGPATGIWICGPLKSLIDTAVIGQGSSLELAALGRGSSAASDIYVDISWFG